MQKMLETQVQSLGGEEPLERRVGIHSSFLAWRILWTEEPSEPQVHRVTKSQTRLKGLSMHASTLCVLSPLKPHNLPSP